VSKTITIKNSVYNELKEFKKENESFSELLDRLINSQSKKDILKSLRGSIEFESKEKIFKELEEKRWEKRD
jgi:predicted CopG family antitoxin